MPWPWLVDGWTVDSWSLGVPSDLFSTFTLANVVRSVTFVASIFLNARSLPHRLLYESIMVSEMLLFMPFKIIYDETPLPISTSSLKLKSFICVK